MKRDFTILLVNPWVTDFSLYDFWIKPLGLLLIGSIFKRESLRVFLLDFLDRHNSFFREKLTKEELKKIRNKKFSTGKFLSREIEKPPLLRGVKRKYKIYGWYEDIIRDYLKNLKGFDYILLTSGMTYWYPGIRKTIDFLKEFYPDSHFILGGRYVFLCKEHAEKIFPDVTIVPERKIKSILERLSRIMDIEIDLDKYLRGDDIYFDFYLEYPVLKHFAVVRTLGCPFSCSYCVSGILFPEFYEMSGEKIIGEIERINRIKGAKDLAFYDDALLYPKEKFKIFLKKLIEANLDIRFHTPNAIHARYIDEEMAYLLRKANFKTIRIGFETINEEKLEKFWSKKLTLKHFEKAIKILRRAGFDEIGAYILIGTEEDNFDEIMRSYEYLYNKKIKIYPAQFSPVPSTDFFDKGLDPILSNKSLYFKGNKDIGFDLYEKIKDFAKILNRNIKENYSFRELMRNFLPF